MGVQDATTASLQEISFRQWQAHYPGLAAPVGEKYYQAWKNEAKRVTHAEELLQQAAATLPQIRATQDQAGRYLVQARRQLEPHRYQIALLGESGAGKSTLTNSLLGIKLLAGITGGTVTGVASHITFDPDIVDESEEFAKVYYRTGEDFADLLARLGERHNVAIPTTLEELRAAFGDAAAPSPASAQEPANWWQQAGEQPSIPMEQRFARLPETLRQSLLKDVRDIARTWEVLLRDGLIGEVRELRPLRTRLDELNQLGSEKSSLNNAAGETRIVAGIARVEYVLGTYSFPAEIKDQLTQISLVDTPGLGAVTPRHREILQKEMEQADAIIFAVDSARPVKEDSLTAAALINENLFSGYSEQERERYAQKIFLVANKYDLILRPDESEAFRQSITELAATISNTLLEQVKSPARNSRYYSVVAKLSLLAQVQAKGGQLDAADQTEYENMVRNVLHQRGKSGPLSPQELDELSNIPRLRESLFAFLSERRLQLSLEEANACIDRAVRLIGERCNTVLLQHGVDPHAISNISFEQSRYILALCKTKIREDRDALQGRRREFGEALNTWRISPTYKAQLAETATGIYQTMRNHINDELPATMAALVTQGVDEITGAKYSQAAVYSLLLKLETYMRREMEAQSESLANFYLKAFNRILETEGLFQLLHNRGYGQGYIEELGIYQSLEAAQKEVHANVRSLCRWCLLYELLQRLVLPTDIDPKFRENSNILWEIIVGQIAPQLQGEASEILLGSFGMVGAMARVAEAAAEDAAAPGVAAAPAGGQPSTGGSAPEGAGASADGSTPAGTSVPARAGAPAALTTPLIPKETALFSDHDIAGTLYRLSLQKDYLQVYALVSEELEFRYRAAIGIALPMIESLFLYEVGKFKESIDGAIEQLYSAHNSQLDAVPDSPLRTELVPPDDSSLGELQSAFGLLENLERFTLGGWQPNSAPVPAGADPAAAGNPARRRAV